MTSLPERLLDTPTPLEKKIFYWVKNKLTLDDGHDSTLLDSRGTLKTIGVDTYI